MAMKMQGEVELPASRELVWTKLNDAEVLKACIPGCQSLDKTSETEMKAVAKVKIGPVSATFKGAVTLSDLDPPNGYRISGQGEGGIAGFAKGGAIVKLEPSGGHHSWRLMHQSCRFPSQWSYTFAQRSG